MVAKPVFPATEVAAIPQAIRDDLRFCHYTNTPRMPVAHHSASHWANLYARYQKCDVFQENSTGAFPYNVPYGKIVDLEGVMLNGPCAVLDPGCGWVVIDIDAKLTQDEFESKYSDRTYESYCSIYQMLIDYLENKATGAWVEESCSRTGRHYFLRADYRELGVIDLAYAMGEILICHAVYMTGHNARIIGDSSLAEPGAHSGILRQLIDSLYQHRLAGMAASVEEKAGVAGMTRAGNVALANSPTVEHFYFRNARLDVAGLAKRLAHQFPESWKHLNWPGTGKGVQIGDWSEAFMQIVGDCDKICGDPATIWALISRSPFAVNGKPADNGRLARLDKCSRIFDYEMGRARVRNATYRPNAHVLLYGDFDYHQDFGRRLVEAMAAGQVVVGSYEARMQHAHSESESKFIGKQYNDYLKTVDDQDGRFSPNTVKAMKFIIKDLVPEKMLEFSVPDGNLGDYTRFCAQAMYAPNLELALPSTLAIMSGLVGQLYKYQNNGLNLMIVLGARSGGGKSQARAAWETLIGELMDKAAFPMTERIFGTNMESKAGIHTTFQDLSSFAWVSDECEEILAKLQTTNDAHAAALRSTTLKIYDMSSDSYKLAPNASASSRTNRRDRVLRNVNVSVFWLTTIKTLQQYLTERFMSDGYGSRILFVTYTGLAAKPQPLEEILRELPQGKVRMQLLELLRVTQDLIDAYRAAPKVDDDKAPPPPQDSQADKLRHVKEREAAHLFRQQIHARMHDYVIALQTDALGLPEYYDMFQRLAMTASRMAALMAVLDNPNDPWITLYHYQWAYGYCLQLIGSTVSAFDNNVYGVALDKSQQVLCDTFREIVRRSPDAAEHGWPLGKMVEMLRNRAPFCNNKNVANKEIHAAIRYCVDQLQYFVEVPAEATGKVGKRGKMLKMTDDPYWRRE